MPRVIRFHLDENCDPRVALGLRKFGINVTTSIEAGLLHATDEQQLAYAALEGRVFFTQDADFLRVDPTMSSHPGIAYCRPQVRSIGEIIRILVLLWEIYDPAEMKDRVEYL